MKGVIREGVKSPACRKRPLMKFSDEDFSCHVSNCVCVCEWVFELTVCELSLSLIFCLCKCGSVTVSDSAYVCLRVSVFVYLCVYKKRVRENLSHPLWKARKTD